MLVLFCAHQEVRRLYPALFHLLGLKKLSVHRATDPRGVCARAIRTAMVSHIYARPVGLDERKLSVRPQS